jgi:hypothetical protein
MDNCNTNTGKSAFFGVGCLTDTGGGFSRISEIAKSTKSCRREISELPKCQDHFLDVNLLMENPNLSKKKH